MHKISSRLFFNHYPKDDFSWKKWTCIGAISTLFWKTISTTKVAFAQGNIEHVAHEIVNHVIWEKIGHFTGIGMAAGFLGAIFTFQNLGEPDVVYISKAASRPIAVYDMNPATNRFEQCVILANGKKLFGQEILEFYQTLQFVRFLPNYKDTK